jgi:hypothetical protein
MELQMAETLGARVSLSINAPRATVTSPVRAYVEAGHTVRYDRLQSSRECRGVVR